MATFGNTLDAYALDPTTGLPLPGVELYAWADESGGAPLLSVLSGLDGSFGWEYDTTADGQWVSAGLTGPRVYVPNNDALAARATTVYVDERLATKANAATLGVVSAKVDTTETRVGTVEDELSNFVPGDMTGAADGDALLWDAATGKAKPGTPAGAASPDGPMSRWLRKLGDDPANAKVVFSGDSTTEGAAQMYSALKVHRFRGGSLDGMASANLVNHGNTGFLLSDFLTHATTGTGPVPANTWAATVAAAPHLIVASWLINDVRGGTVTEAQARARLVQLVELVADDLPNTDLVLRIPNPMVTTGGSFISGITAAEANRRIREAYLSLVDVYPHVTILDSAPVFGRSDLATSWLMSDQLHPTPQGHWLTGHHIARSVGLPSRVAPAMGPPSRYVRTGYVNAVSGTQLHIDAVEWAGGGATPNARNAQEWIVDAASTIYTEGGAVSLSGVTKSKTAAQTLVLTKSGFDWSTVAAAGQMVQIVGHHAPEGIQAGGIETSLDLPSIAPGTSYSTTLTIAGARVMQGVVAAPHQSLPAGLIWSAMVTTDDTVRLTVFNGTAAAIDHSWTPWLIWLAR